MRGWGRGEGWGGERRGGRIGLEGIWKGKDRIGRGKDRIWRGKERIGRGKERRGI